jgi:hypothetical protein
MTEETKPSGYLSRGSGGELLSPEALAILDALPIEEKKHNSAKFLSYGTNHRQKH